MTGEHISAVNLQFALFSHTNQLANLFVDDNLYNELHWSVEPSAQARW